MNFTAATTDVLPTMRAIFRGVHHALGEEHFAGLINAYAVSSDIASLAECFPTYLRDRAPHLPYRNFLVQLASLEHTLHAVRDDDEPGDRLRLMRFDYPVSDYLRAVEQLVDQGMDDAEVIGAPVGTRRCWVAVYRHGRHTGRMTISPGQFNSVLDWLTQRQPANVFAVSAVN